MKTAIIDLDGTLIQEETLPYMLKSWGKLSNSMWPQCKMTIRIAGLFLGYKSGLLRKMDKKRFRRAATVMFLDIFKGMEEEEIREYFANCAELLMPKTNADVAARLETLKSQGYYCVLLSGGYQPFVEAVGSSFGFHKVIGSPIRFTAIGIDYSNPITVIMGNRKLEALSQSMTEEIDWEGSTAFADSYYDTDLLKQVGHPVAVNPDEILRAHAVKHGWEILDSDSEKS